MNHITNYFILENRNQERLQQQYVSWQELSHYSNNVTNVINGNVLKITYRKTLIIERYDHPHVTLPNCQLEFAEGEYLP